MIFAQSLIRSVVLGATMVGIVWLMNTVVAVNSILDLLSLFLGATGGALAMQPWTETW